MPRFATYAPLEAPIGRLWLAGGDAGLLAISRSESPEPLLVQLRRRGWEPAVEPDALIGAMAQLSSYFGGVRRRLDLLVDLRGLPSFHAAVYRAAMEIPYGTTVSYGELAAVAGSPRAARAVGGAMARCPLFPVVPCHRVIHADGSIGGWGSDPWVKRWLLDLESGNPPFDGRKAIQHGAMTDERTRSGAPPS